MHPFGDEEVEMDTSSNHEKGDLENSNEAKKLFEFYGEIVTKLDLPLFEKCAP